MKKQSPQQFGYQEDRNVCQSFGLQKHQMNFMATHPKERRSTLQSKLHKEEDPKLGEKQMSWDPCSLSSAMRLNSSGINVRPLDGSVDQHISDAGLSFGSNFSPASRKMTMAELLAVAQPLCGPDFDPDVHIEEWSDDSSDEEEDEPVEKTDDELLAELLGGSPEPNDMLPLRRTPAAIYMPIRVNCLYG